jgi:hypothetical protein
MRYYINLKIDALKNIKQKYEIKKLYENNEIITTCCVLYKAYIDNEIDVLPIKHKGKWVEDHIPLQKDYRHFSHGYHPDVYNKLINNIHNVEETDLEEIINKYKK